MKVNFRPVTKDDINFLYELFQERLKYPKAIRFKTGEIPSYEQHKEFVINHLKGNGYLLWNIILLDNESVGAVVLKKDGEWGYHVSMKHWSKGIGQLALAWLIEKYPNMVLTANIKVGNDIARHIAEKFGHKIIAYKFVRVPDKQNVEI